MKRFSLVFLLVLFTATVFAQNVRYNDARSWFLLLNRAQLSDKWSVTNELHERTFEILADQGQFLFRPSLDYHFNDNSEASVGYTFINMVPMGKAKGINLNEHNMWEQLFFSFTSGKVQFQNRLRQEHRWVERIAIQNNELVKSGANYSNRFRYRMTASVDVFTFKKSGHALFVNAFDEIWINQSSNLMPSNFARNWLYVGAGYAFDKATKIQLGYMNQYDNLGGNLYSSTPIGQLTFIKNFDFRKTE
jgi:hypothetical protein